MPASGAAFETFRPLLFAIAYRMVGSVVEAEDIVQETYLRYSAADCASIRSLKAFLTTVVTRLSIDFLKSAATQRESYIGAWLPEPLLTKPGDEPGDQPADLAALNDSLSIAFLVLLERLNPVERAVFLLREVFDYDYETVAGILGKSESACRQAFHRARAAIQAGKPRFRSTAEEHRQVFTQFLQACAQGDVKGLESLLAADVTAVSDGGGKASAATRPLSGSRAVGALMLGLFKRAPANLQYDLVEVNGRAGLLVRQDQVPILVMMVEVVEGKITALWSMRNPDKLGRLQRVSEPRP